jgi:outer membrane protein TolC
MSLQDALDISLQQNPSILDSRNDLEIAHGISVQTRAIFMPKVVADGLYAHDEAREKSPFITDPGFEPPDDRWGVGIRLVQTIYQGGRLTSALHSSRLVREQAVFQYETVVQDTLLAVRTAYYQVLLTEQQVAVHQASVELLTEQLTNTQRRFAAGAVAQFDVLRAEVELADEKPQLIGAQDDFRLAKNDLATILGCNLPTNICDDIPLQLTGKLEAEPWSLDLPNSLAQSIDRRPELGALQKEVQLRAEEVKVAKSGYKPVVSLFGGYTDRSSSYRSDPLWTVGGPLVGAEASWDIFDGNLTRGKVMEARGLLAKADINLEAGARRIHSEVRSAYSSLVRAREVLESQQKVQEKAEEALRLADSRYQAGSSTQLDVLTAQTSLTQARTTQIAALFNYAVARAKLSRAIGFEVSQTDNGGTGK